MGMGFAKTSYFDVTLFTYFCFCFPWLGRYILNKNIAKTNVKKYTAYIFSKKFYGFTSSTVFNSSCIHSVHQ